MIDEERRRAHYLWPMLLVVLLALVGCDPGGRLAQLTPQAPAATPMLLGVTAESPAGSGLATAGPESPGTPVDEPVPLPTPTYDPALPAWTILYYAAAENGSAPYVWDDLNEMESAGPADQVRLVAQVDWPENGPAGTSETVRYLVQPDTDGTQLASEVVATLGEANMGDPAALADFLAWGMATYPANRYALVLGDFGGGWQGCCFDSSTGESGPSDRLSLPDIDEALATAYGQTGARLEVVAFSAGLMNQLDVLQVLVPYAGFAVGSAGLLPGSGWDWQAVVAQLNAEPLVDGRQFSGDLVTAFVNYQRQMAGDEFAGMAAVELSRVPALAAAVESLALSIGNDPALHGAIAADARRGAQQYGAAAITDADTIAAVDLLQAAAIIAETAPPGELQSAAGAVSARTTEALVAYDHGQGIPNGRGVAIYWPASSNALDPHYQEVSRLPAWADYLASASPAPATATHVTIDGGPRQTVNIANPALMRSELVGQRVGEVALMADQEAADGRRVLRQYESVQPAAATLPGGTTASRWPDGRHESLIIWDATASFLSDAAGTGDFAVIRPVDHSPVGPQLAVAGRFLPGGGEAGMAATAIFNESDAGSRRVWAIASDDSGARLVGEVAPAEGDVFEASTLFVEPDGALSSEPGTRLIFDSTPAIYRSTRPLPAGNYAVGVRATWPNGLTAATQPLVVDPAGAAAGFRAFVDVARDVQFLYPADWLPPVSQEDVTFTSNISGTAQLQIRYYPGWTSDLDALQAEVMTTFGEVSILQQEDAHVGSGTPVDAVRTAYGYESADQGSRTGMFLTFLKDGTGYVVDLDAPRAQETATLAAIDTIAATWQFLPDRLGFGPESWAVLNVSEFRMTYPAAYSYQEFNNWHRFTADAQSFVAVRIQPSARTPAEAMSGLLQTAAEGVSGFSADEPQRLFYAGYVWERNDFHYTDANGAIVAGLLLSRADGDSEIAVWAEAPDPATDFVSLSVLPTAASIERIPPPPSG